MGAGASALGADDPGRNATNPTGNLNLTRLRKSLLIRAYNVRNQGIASQRLIASVMYILYTLFVYVESSNLNKLVNNFHYIIHPKFH